MKGRIWAIELAHPDTRRFCTRLNVSVVSMDSPTRLVFNLGERQVFEANKALEQHSRDKDNPVTLNHFMEQVGRYTYRIDTPDRNPLIAVKRQAVSMNRKIQAVCKNPTRALNDPDTRDIAIHMLGLRK